MASGTINKPIVLNRIYPTTEDFLDFAEGLYNKLANYDVDIGLANITGVGYSIYIAMKQNNYSSILMFSYGTSKIHLLNRNNSGVWSDKTITAT